MTSMAMGTVQTTGSQENDPVWTIQAPAAPRRPKSRKTAKSPRARALSSV